MDQIVFWQRMVSPHMFPLALALHARGYHVTYMIEELMLEDRRQMGWEIPESSTVNIATIENRRHSESFVPNAVHLVEGVRGNGVMKQVRKGLLKCHARWGTLVETIDERSWHWPLKRLVYRGILSIKYYRPDFVLAIGADTSRWIKNRGFPAEHIFPFAYFLSDDVRNFNKEKKIKDIFTIGYVGRFINLKRIDLLIDALSDLTDLDFKLVMVGDGPLHEKIKQYAYRKLGSGKYEMTGVLPRTEVANLMRNFDCLVLPSDHDGWGAVVSEALMAGVPAICSDACGAAEAVRASGVGGVFAKGNVQHLRQLLQAMIIAGPLDEQRSQALSNWAQCLGARAGAAYLVDILKYVYEEGIRPIPPWRVCHVYS